MYSLVYIFYWIFRATIFLITNVLPLLVQIIILQISFILACLLWVITLGSLDFNLLLTNVNTSINMITNLSYQILVIIITNLPYFMIYSALYLLLLGFVYIKYIFCKSKGYMNRANQLESSIDAYLIPIRVIMSIVSKIKELLSGYV
jgi:hypothetical protein